MKLKNFVRRLPSIFTCSCLRVRFTVSFVLIKISTILPSFGMPRPFSGLTGFTNYTNSTDINCGWLLHSQCFNCEEQWTIFCRKFRFLIIIQLQFGIITINQKAVSKKYCFLFSKYEKTLIYIKLENQNKKIGSDQFFKN